MNLKLCKKYFGSLFLALISLSLSGQFQITDATNPPFSPDNLVNNILLGEGVAITDVKYVGEPSAAGYFSNASSIIGIESGIVLSTDAATKLEGPKGFNSIPVGTSGEILTDSNLSSITDGDLVDIARFEISFIPVADTLEFKYVFASDEYPNFVCARFNDIFGFFISGPNPNGGFYDNQNIALVPDLNDPSGKTFTNFPVAINTVNNGVKGSQANETENCQDPGQSLNFSAYFNESNSDEISLNAYIDAFIAQAIVIPCQEYTISLAIADVFDGSFDSAVFLEGNSFGTNSLKISSLTESVDGTISEGCENATVRIDLPGVMSTPQNIAIRVLDDPSLPSIAEENVDYFISPPIISIAAGNLLGQSTITALEDNVDESVEYIYLEIEKDICTRDTLVYRLVDNEIGNFELENDRIICGATSTIIDLKPPDDLPVTNDNSFTSTEPLLIDTEKVTLISEIEVVGVVPSKLNARSIAQVCIEDLEHPILQDLDIFLQAPDGSILELSTDNGGDGGNGLVLDRLSNTCFNLLATENINNGNSTAGPLFPDNINYTGNYLPEQSFDQLPRANTPANGTWSLIIIDDQDNDSFGSLNRWSLRFNPSFSVAYNWYPKDDIIGCTTCEDVEVAPNIPTKYFVDIVDSYGCTYVDSILVTPGVDIDAPVLNNCQLINTNDLEVNWSAVNGADSYEISVNNQEWIGIENRLDTLLENVAFNTDYQIRIRALGAFCPSDITVCSVTTPSCNAPSADLDIRDATSGCVDNGMVTVVNLNGVTPFSFELNGERNQTGIFNNLGQGDYQLTVLDALSCPLVLDFSIAQPDPVTTSPLIIKPISCTGDADAVISFALSSGDSPFVFWDDYPQGNTVNNVGPGVYRATIRDAVSGCELRDSVVLTDPPIFQIDVAENINSCFNSNTGMIRISNTGSGTGLSYNWSHNSILNSDTAHDLSPGTYMVTVTNQTGCQRSLQNILIESESEIVAMPVAVNLLCAEENKGEASFEVNGGIGPYSFVWSNGATDSLLIDLAPDNYSVRITDQSGCEINAGLTLSGPAPIAVSETIIMPECNNEADGVIELDISGGIGAYTASWDTGDVGTRIENVGAGQICVEIRDENNCLFSTCFIVEEPDALTISPEQLDIDCFGADNGAINIDVDGGLGPYRYAWSGDNFSADTKDLSALLPGTYQLVVTDFNDCSTFQSFEILESDEIQIVSQVVDVSCFGDASGMIILDLANGAEPFQFNWIGPNGFSSNDQNISNLTFGNYRVFIEDANGCSKNLDVNLAQPETPLSIISTTRDTICAGDTNGSFNVSVTGGTGGYEYSWSTGSTSVSESNLPAGVYQLLITDDANCLISETFTVDVQQDLDLVLDLVGPSCESAQDATATLVSASRNGQNIDLSDLDIVWNASTAQVGSIATDLFGGETFVLQITDDRGCQTIESILIPETSPIEVILTSKNDASCSGFGDGVLEIAGRGGTEPYEYMWSHSQTGPIASGLTKGNYTVTVSDQNGCSSEESFTIDDGAAIQTVAQNFDVLCFGESTGRAQIIASGGAPPFQIAWPDGSTEFSIGELEVGEYRVTLTDSNNCSAEEIVLIEGPEMPVSIDVELSNPTCGDNSFDGKIMVNASGGAGNYTYSNNGVDFVTNPELIGMSAGLYDITVRDQNGCEAMVFDVELTSNDGPQVSIDGGDNASAGFGATFTPVIDSGLAPYSIEWSTDPFTEVCLTCETLSFSNLQDPFVIQLQVTDANGCVQTVSKFVNVVDFSFINIPTGFTPDGNGNNDMIHVFGKRGIIVEKFQVFSRWGNLVYEDGGFETNDTSRGWDGRFKGDLLPSDTYIWAVDVLFEDGRTERFKGSTQLLR